MTPDIRPSRNVQTPDSLERCETRIQPSCCYCKTDALAYAVVIAYYSNNQLKDFHPPRDSRGLARPADQPPPRGVLLQWAGLYMNNKSSSLENASVTER